MTPDTAAAASVPVIAPRGNLDLETSRDLASRLSELAGSTGDAVLDLTDVSFIDSIGLGVVVKSASRFQRQDKQLVIVVPEGGAPDRLLEFSGLGGRLSVVRSREAALERAVRRR
jgi:anti-sigma B factor antagonist